MRAQHHETNSLDDHIELIRERIEASMADPQSRALAATIVSGSFDSARDPRTGESVPVVKYHGRYYRGALNWNEASKVCAARDYKCEITAIWNFAVLNVRYTGEAMDMDVYQDVRTILETGAADCDDTTILFATLLKHLGYSVQARVISVDGRKWAHIYPRVKIPGGRWLALDMTEPNKKPGWEYAKPKAVQDYPL